MNRPLVDRIADAVMYEGYILYPYRPSIKNHQRWTFGGLFPEDYCRATRNGDRSSNQTECPLRGTSETRISVRVRFLHLTNRQVGAIEPPVTEWNEAAPPRYRIVPSLCVSGTTHHAWQEAEEREITLSGVSLLSRIDPCEEDSSNSSPRGMVGASGQPCPDHESTRRQTFTFPASRRFEPIRDDAGQIVGVLIREQEAIAGSLDLQATEIRPGLFRMTVRVACQISMECPETLTRDEAALRSLVSTHTILSVSGGEFASLADPPEWSRDVAKACKNVGTWPVLVGEVGEKDTILSAPIILPDYPQIAPESPGDFFDGTEMDEMLTLRILTLTDDEKESMSAVDRRAHALLSRTESMNDGTRMGLHGVLRGGWSTEEVADVQPGT